MRKLGVGIAVFIGLIILVLLIAPAFINVNTYHDKIQAELQQRLGRSVSLGTMHLRLLPPKFRVDDVTIGDDPRFSASRPFAQAQELDVAIKLLPLLHKEVAISSLELVRPHVELIRNAQGAWNFATLGKSAPANQSTSQHTAPAENPTQPNASRPPTQRNAKQAPPSQPAATTTSAHPPQKQPQQAFALDNLRLTDGQIALTDFQKHQSRAVYDHIDLQLKNFAVDEPFSISATAHLPGTGKQVVNLDWHGGPLNSDNMINTPFQGTLKLEQVPLDAAQKFLNAPALAGTDAVISGTMHVNNQTGQLASDGSIKLEKARIRGVDVGYPISADYEVTDNLNTDVLNIAKGSLRLGSAPLSLTGTMDTKPTPAQVNLQLKAGDISISEIARLASAFGVAFNPGTTINGRLTADVHAQGPTSQPALNGTLSARNVQISGKDVPQPVSVNALDLTLTPTQVRSNPFSAVAGSTNVALQVTLAQYTSPSPAVDATLRTANAQINELLNIAKAYGVSALAGASGSGVLTLNVHATGPLKNASAMNFSGNGNVRNATLKTPSLTQPLNLRNADLQFTQNSAILQNLTAALGQSDASGNLTVRNFSAPQVQFNISANRINVQELQQITSPANPPAAKRASNHGWSILPSAYAAPAPQPGILQKITGNGTINVATIMNDQLILNNVRSNVALDRGLIRMAPLTAQLYGGTENGAVILDTRQTPPAVNVNTTLSNVDANKLVSSVSSLKQTLYGILSTKGQLGFSAASSTEIARTLNGATAIDLSKGRIMGMDLLREVGNIGKFLNGQQQAKPYTDIMKLAGHFNIKNGVAQTNDLQATIDGGSLGAVGAVGLADQSINLHLSVVLSKWFTQKVGGNSVGGFMNTALQNDQGELVIPVIVTGTFQHPQFAPDIEQVAQMKLKHLLPSSKNPGGMVSGVLGNILGNQGGQQATPQTQQNQPQQNQQQDPNADAVNNVLNQVFGGKKKQQQPPPPQK
ncbi:MAG TPA: AsmA family protein [Terriglobales bacterium]|nr:AsmA family protein [Terriglobales bacterium]